MLSIEQIRNGALEASDAGTQLGRLGFSVYFGEQILPEDHPDWVVARVAGWDGIAGEVWSDRSRAAELSGKMRQEALPATGDWVLARVEGERLVIQRLLRRRTQLVRRASGRGSEPQVVVANVDVIFIVTSANRDLNERRLERYLTAAWDSGAEPVVVLNKVDLIDACEPWLDRVRQVARGVSILAVSAQSGEGLQRLEEYATVGKTLVLVGSSGVGKSSIINRWLGGSVQRTHTIDAEERGRHTTTRRSLLPLPNGAVLIDTPGMREFGLVETRDGLDAVFDDVVRFAAACRFTDCRHAGEPGCAVAAAVEGGELAPERLESYGRLQRETEVMQARTDQRLAQSIKRQHKLRTKAVRSHYSVRGKPR